MATVFITLWRFPIYFEIHVATTARENVTSIVLRTLSAQTCEFNSSAFAAGGRILPIGLY